MDHLQQCHSLNIPIKYFSLQDVKSLRNFSLMLWPYSTRDMPDSLSTEHLIPSMNWLGHKLKKLRQLPKYSAYEERDIWGCLGWDELNSSYVYSRMEAYLLEEKLFKAIFFHMCFMRNTLNEFLIWF